MDPTLTGSLHFPRPLQASPAAPLPLSFEPLFPAPRPPSRRYTVPDVLSPESKCVLLSKAKQRHQHLCTKINLLEQENRTREGGKKPTPEHAVYAAIEEMCSNTRLVGRSLALKVDNVERLTMLTNRVEEYLSNSLRQSLPYNNAGPGLGLAEIASELHREQEERATLSRMLQAATDRLVEEAAETDAQVILAANLRQSLIDVTSELERTREEASRSQAEAEQLREANHRMQAELKFASEERQLLTGHLRQMVDTLAEENDQLKAAASRIRDEHRLPTDDALPLPIHINSSALLRPAPSIPPPFPTVPVQTFAHNLPTQPASSAIPSELTIRPPDPTAFSHYPTTPSLWNPS